MCNSINTEAKPLPKVRNRLSPALSIFASPLLILLALLTITHSYEFQYVHLLVPNLLLFYVSEEKIPLALLGIQFIFTYYITAIGSSFSRTFIKEKAHVNPPSTLNLKPDSISYRIQRAYESNVEIFPAFASAVIAGTLTAMPQYRLVYFAVCYNLAQIGYTLALVNNLVTLYTLFHYIGVLSVTFIFMFSTVQGFDAYFKALCHIFYATPF